MCQTSHLRLRLETHTSFFLKKVLKLVWKKLCFWNFFPPCCILHLNSFWKFSKWFRTLPNPFTTCKYGMNASRHIRWRILFSPFCFISQCTGHLLDGVVPLMKFWQRKKYYPPLTHKAKGKNPGGTASTRPNWQTILCWFSVLLGYRFHRGFIFVKKKMSLL